MRSRQQGASGLFIAVLLLLIIGGMLAIFAFLQSKGQSERSGQETQRFEKINAALVQFVAINGRLPCPANPTANPETGLENRTALSATCNSPTGTVPWASIGLRRDDAIDAWGWKISYRVYTGSNGSLTQDGGATMVNCETDTGELAGWSAGRTPVSGSSGGLCRSTRNTLESEFLAGKGLSVTSFGTAVSDVAYVLISHGASGLGAYTSGTPSVQKELPTSANELSNLNAAGPFIATAHTDATVGPAASTHFDDVLAYKRLSDLVRLAGVGPRDWPETTALADVTLNAAGVGAAIGTTPTAGTDLGTASINFDTARVSGLTSGTASNLSFDSASGTEGVGVYGNGTGISSAYSEAIRVELRNKATKFAVTLNNFNTVFVWKERARLEFYDGNTLVRTFSPWQSCHSGAFTSFTFDLGAAQYDRVDITPLASAPDPLFGTTIATSFFLSAFKACSAIPCETSLQSANPALTCSGA
jgi:hypothetical protein